MYRRHTSQHQFLWRRRRRLGGTLRRTRSGGRRSGGSTVLLGRGEGEIVTKRGFTGNNYRAPANGRLTCSLTRSGCNCAARGTTKAVLDASAAANVSIRIQYMLWERRIFGEDWVELDWYVQRSQYFFACVCRF